MEALENKNGIIFIFFLLQSFFLQSRSNKEDPEQMRLKQKAKEVIGKVQTGFTVKLLCFIVISVDK